MPIPLLTAQEGRAFTSLLAGGLTGTEVVIMHDAMETNMQGYDEHVDRRDHEEHDQVGTVEVQILLSWFFESSLPSDVAIDLPRAA